MRTQSAGDAGREGAVWLVRSRLNLHLLGASHREQGQRRSVRDFTDRCHRLRRPTLAGRPGEAARVEQLVHLRHVREFRGARVSGESARDARRLLVARPGDHHVRKGMPHDSGLGEVHHRGWGHRRSDGVYLDYIEGRLARPDSDEWFTHHGIAEHAQLRARACLWLARCTPG